MYRGYIKLWRRSVESGMIRHHKTWILWTYLLLKVTHKHIEVRTGHEKVKLLPGQIISGRNKLAQETGLSVRTVRTVLNNLKSTNKITIKTTNKYSIITIVNWDRYQSNEEIADQQNDQEADQRPTSNRPLNKNVKNVKNTKKPASGSFFQKIDALLEQVQGIAQERKLRFNARQWVMVQQRNGIHPGAIAEALGSMISMSDTIEDFWAWGDRVVKVQSGNYAEADSQAESAAHKQGLIDLIASIRQDQ